MQRRARLPDVSRLMLWASALVLIAGLVVFVTVRLGSGGASPSLSSPAGNGTASPTTEESPADVSQVPRAARVAAGQFILAAVGRENLRKAWNLSHPDLKAQCGCTFKQWLSGNIPIQPFPTSGLEGVTYAVDELTADSVVLLVYLTARPGSEITDGLFLIGLKPVAKGKNRTWLVDYWAPKSPIPIPQSE